MVLLVLGSRGYPGDRGPLDFVMDFSLKLVLYQIKNLVRYMAGETHPIIIQTILLTNAG